MSLRFIYGRSGSGKSHYCLEDIKNKIDKGEKQTLILLVPEQFSFQAEKNLIHAVGEKGIFKAQVLSFKRMVHKVFNEVGGITHKRMNASGKSMLIYKIMDENKDNLKIFTKMSKNQGFVNVISEIITELKKYNVTCEKLKDTIEYIDNKNLKDKMEDIYLIFSKFQQNLHEKYIDEDDDLTILAEKIDKSNLFNGAEVWIDEFFNFTPQEYKILEKIFIKAKKVNITFCIDLLHRNYSKNDSDVFSLVKNTEEKILQIMKNNNIKYDKPIVLNCNPCYRFKNSKEISHLEQSLFSFPYKIYDKETVDIKLFKALNKYSEIDEVARSIISTCRDKGIRFNNIAVVSGDLKGYEKLIRAIFNGYDIPYFIDKKREIDNNPIIILIISSIEILSKNWSYEAVFRYLKTGLLDLQKDEIDIIENYVLSNGIRGSKWTKDEKWEYRLNYSLDNKEMSQYEQEVLEKVNNIREKIVSPLKEFYLSIKGKKTARDMCEGLYNFLCSINVPEKIQFWIEYFKEQGNLDVSNQYKQIWDIVIEVLDQIVEVMGEDKINIKQFSQILDTGFKEYEIGLIPPTLDQVLVSSIQRIRSYDIKALYIIGTNDGVFPGTINDEGILNDNDREDLKIKGLEIGEGTTSRCFQEQFFTYITLTSMSKYLLISYPISDYEGKTMRPSIVISRLKKIFPNVYETSDIISNSEKDLEIISSPKATFNKLICKIRKDIEESNIQPLWLDVYRWYDSNPIWKEKLHLVFKGFLYSNKADIIDRKKIRKLYGKHMNISVSRIEKYAQCPFAYFIKYGLKAKERKIYKLSPPDIGTFMHNILEKFSNILLQKNMSWNDVDEQWCKAVVPTIVDNTINNSYDSIFNSSARYKHMVVALKRILTRSICTISEQIKKGGFEPKGYEVSFGREGDFPPIYVKLDSGETISLIGRVDRIDTFKEESNLYLRIIDYKSGNKDFKLSDVYYGIQIQLLAYLDAVLTEISYRIKENPLPGGILYFKIDDPIIKTKGEMSDEKIQKAIIQKFKMKGLLLSDTEVIKEMDKEIKGNSLIIPARINKDGSLGKSSAADLEHFNLLRQYVKDMIIDLCEEMLQGNIEIKPYKKKNFSPCSFCEYSNVCKFDSSIKENGYRIIKDKTDEEVWKLIEQKLKDRSEK